jgi:hypothetical protein
MTQNEVEDVIMALIMRINYIQTGNIALSANDAVACKKHKIIKALDPPQKEAISRMEKLVEKFRKRPPKFDKTIQEALNECKSWRLTDEEMLR